MAIFKRGDEVTAAKLNALDRPDPTRPSSQSPTIPSGYIPDHRAVKAGAVVYISGGEVVSSAGARLRLSPAAITVGASGSASVWVVEGSGGMPSYSADSPASGAPSVKVWDSSVGQCWVGAVDLRAVTPGTVGGQVTAVQAGYGAQVVHESGLTSVLTFRALVAGDNVTLDQDDGHITVHAAGGLTVVSGSGSGAQVNTLIPGSGIDISLNGSQATISATSAGGGGWSGTMAVVHTILPVSANLFAVDVADMVVEDGRITGWQNDRSYNVNA